ncbi:MAG: HAMP domain-containing histidine kinase [Lachnospiraceae bacterium]|nr:HAMP domain-containing histidine kinase [Lachnospiraceae bacterium]
MMRYLGVLCVALFTLCVLLLLKICLMRRAAREISWELENKLSDDTNTLMGISSRDSSMRRLAGEINRQLRVLNQERRRFQQGDRELKEAVTNISHDLRTPLTAISGYLDLLESEVSGRDASRYLSMIRNRIQMLTELTEELFRYSMITSTEDRQREWLTLNSVLEESLASYYAAFLQRNITPKISIPEEKAERFLSRSALMRIFGNIISNSLKYSDGDLSVVMKADGTILFANEAKALTPVLVGRLFDRFYTVETGCQSTGLGLAISKQLCERMGGHIQADYQDGRLLITLYFPKSPR